MTLRADGRQSNELRPLQQSHTPLTRVDASSEFSFGPVRVISSVTGPEEVRQRDEKLDAATLAVNVSPLRGLSDLTHKAASQSLSMVVGPLLNLHLHPRSLVQISLQTAGLPSTKYSKPFTTFSAFSDGLSKDNGEDIEEEEEEAEAMEYPSCVHEAALLNAAVLSCLESGLSMKGTAAAVGLARSSDGTWLLDPSPEEERDASLCLVLAFAFGVPFGGQEGQLVWCETVKAKTGFDQDSVGPLLFDPSPKCRSLMQFPCQLNVAIEQGRAAAKTILAFFRSSLADKYGVEQPGNSDTAMDLA